MANLLTLLEVIIMLDLIKLGISFTSSMRLCFVIHIQNAAIYSVAVKNNLFYAWCIRAQLMYNHGNHNKKCDSMKTVNKIDVVLE